MFSYEAICAVVNSQICATESVDFVSTEAGVSAANAAGNEREARCAGLKRFLQ